jgi:lipoprotein signal peptidase
MVENRGVSFGWQIPGIEIISVLVLFLVIFCWWKGREKGWWLVFLGGGMNLGERIFYGKVTDYWPILGTGLYNNINDYLIFIGIGIILWEKWKKLK